MDPSSEADVTVSGSAVDMSDDRDSILIVDDESVICSILEQRIRLAGGIDVVTAPNGNMALELLGQRAFDVVLTDICMPGISGIELLREIKSSWPQTIVMIMSGFADLNDTIQALRLGAVDFMEKPFDMAKVVDSIQRLFRRKRLERKQAEALKFQSFEKRVFQIPNDLDVCPVIVAQIIQDLSISAFATGVNLEGVRVALNEILFNAIEHGNLEISYKEKTELMEGLGDYPTIIRERAEQSEYVDRQVLLECQYDRRRLRFVITDEGHGFDHSNLPDPTDPENLLSAHGRGILMTQIYMDSVMYNEKGNRVTLVKELEPETPQ